MQISQTSSTISGNKLGEALELGFFQYIAALRRTLLATPVGWGLVVWLAHKIVPSERIAAWIAIFILGWIINFIVIKRVVAQGAQINRHKVLMTLVALNDGICWGILPLFLMTYDRYLDSWLTIVLCGVASVNIPAYITYPSAFRSLVGSMWLAISISAWTISEHMQAAPQLVLGLFVYFGLFAFTIRPISNRVIEGMRLKLENDALTEDLRDALIHLEQQALTDALTGQMNRHALNKTLDNYIEEAVSRGFQFSLLILDIDHFKKINDTYGHNVGDQALIRFAERINKQLRPLDCCARYGGEEFVILLPETNIETAKVIAERIRSSLEQSALETTPSITVTTSIGVASYKTGNTAEQLIQAADDALYNAKRSGRNKVVQAD